jgi:hypothetical protein
MERARNHTSEDTSPRREVSGPMIFDTRPMNERIMEEADKLGIPPMDRTIPQVRDFLRRVVELDELGDDLLRNGTDGAWQTQELRERYYYTTCLIGAALCLLRFHPNLDPDDVVCIEDMVDRGLEPLHLKVVRR